jgi:hypothetical protein
MLTTTTTCDCCGEDRETPYEYACLPHVVFDALCEQCAVDIIADLDAEFGANFTPPNDANWYFRTKSVTPA